MKVFIQHGETGLFFQDHKRWVKDEKQARSFGSSLPAIDFCHQHKIKEVIIILKFSNPRFDIQLRPFASKHERKGDRTYTRSSPRAASHKSKNSGGWTDSN